MTHTTEPTIEQGWIDDLIYDVRNTCEDCTHPVCLQTIKSAKALVSNQVARAEDRGHSIGFKNGKWAMEKVIAKEVREARIEELLEQQKLLSDINKGYTRNPTNQSNYIRKAIAVDKQLATLNGVKNK